MTATTLHSLHFTTDYNSTTLQLQLELQYITLDPAVVGDLTTATIATTPSNTLQPPFGQSVASLCQP